MIAHTILYVKDQSKSRDFYKFVLGLDPILDVHGMTEFQLSENHILGLMPEAGIKRLLGDKIPDPALGAGIPRAELYIRVKAPEIPFKKAIELGAKELSAIANRPWGHKAGYVLDFDGHILAFAT